MDEPSRQKGETNTQSPKEGTPFAAPSISLPKGGGAIRGIGEKFAASLCRESNFAMRRRSDG